MCKIIVGVLFLLGVAAAVPLPAKDELMFEMGGDTAVVESRVRETRQVPANIDELLKPGVHDAFIHTYGNKEGDIGDIQGYRKRINDKGNEGYEHFDSFHKKDSDKYGFEVHKEFGKSGKGKAEGSGKKKRYASKDNEADAEESKTLYRVSEEPQEKQKDIFGVDGFDHSDSYEGGGESESYDSSGKSDSGNQGGASNQYEVNDSYSRGGSSSYEGGHANDSNGGDSGSYSSGGEKSQSYSAAEEQDDEEEDED